MSLDDVANQIEKIDRQLNGRVAVPDEEKAIDISGLYRRYGWGSGSGPAPLPSEALQKLKLEDKAGDGRWSKAFLGSGIHIGVYRSRVGFYWLLRYDGAINQHVLENVGSAFDVEQRFGKK